MKIYGGATEKEPVISFAIEGMDVKKLEKFLNDEYNIAVRAGQLSAQPLIKHLGLEALLRVLLCYFNTRQEIDLLAEAISAFIEKSPDSSALIIRDAKQQAGGHSQPAIRFRGCSFP